MSIITSELKLYKSATVSNEVANGGRLSVNEIVTGVKNNIFPDVSQAERLAGIIRYRKIFAKLTNAANEILMNPKYHLRSYTPGEDRVEIFEATQSDTQASITGSEQKYGAGSLKTDVSIGDTSLICTLEDSSQDIFEATGNTIFVTNGTVEEYFTNVSASKVGADVTLTFDSGFTLLNNYLTTNTIISSVIFDDGEELKPTFGSVVAATAGDGDYDDTTYPLTGDCIGSVEETFTLTFTSSTEFDCVGAIVGSVGSGNITTNFAPTNTNFSRAYFTLLLSGWTGTWASGDTLTIVSHPAAKALWLKQTVPAGCASYSGDNFYTRFAGESA